MLAAAPGTGYIDEPFNINSILLKKPPHLQWYQYVSDEQIQYYTPLFSDLIEWKYPLWRSLRNIKTAGGIRAIIKDQSRFLRNRTKKARPIIKDPIALFSTGWLAETFTMDVLILIRHPAAFCSSVKLTQWWTDFTYFLRQPALLNRYLRKYENDMRKQDQTNKDVLGNAILFWNCALETIIAFRKEHPDWLFIRHEDLSIDPVNQFHKIYDAFGLEFTRDAMEAILKSTGSHNPIEQDVNAPLMRNSKRNINNWKSRLTKDEIERVRTGTSEIWPLFYSEGDW
jgi:hypothetical protein